MDRIFQWAWDRYGSHYSWAVGALIVFFSTPVFVVWALIIVAFEGSTDYVEAGLVAMVAILVRVYLLVLPGLGQHRVIERWAAGHEADQSELLAATYTFARHGIARGVVTDTLWTAVFMAGVGAIAGAGGWRLVQYGILGAAVGFGGMLFSNHNFVEGMFRPVRAAIAADTGLGDALPRSRPSFAAWATLSVAAGSFLAVISGAMLGVVFDVARYGPALAVVIAVGLTVFSGPAATFASFSPSLRPLRDLAEGTERVAAGDFSQRLPVVQDDDLGMLAASFNRMQAGLAERQRLQVAFGTYVDPALAARLLEQGDDVFTGERREVTVMFVDIRDFTPFAEANPAEDVVARLNALFEIVVPAVVDAGGHVNKFLGDGALAVFGAPNDLADHADAAVNAAVLIHRLVAERFGGELRIGIGINTGKVIAGTIGGGSKLEFTLIGDAVNVAARVEQLTKATGDTILLTQEALSAMASRPHHLADRGAHALKGKAAPVEVFSVA